MEISFSVTPQHIIRENSAYPGGQWLPGAFLNPAKNGLRLNRKRKLNDVAIIWRDEGEDDLPMRNKEGRWHLKNFLSMFILLEYLSNETWYLVHARGCIVSFGLWI